MAFVYTCSEGHTYSTEAAANACDSDHERNSSGQADED